MLNFVMDVKLLLFIVIISSEAAEGMENLARVEGGSITLPDSVTEKGFLNFEGKTIGEVSKREFETYGEMYKDKLFWNNNTGLFTITRLQRNDSGIYHVDSKRGRVFIATYNLTVYESVPTPAVTTVNVSAESCTLLCSVERAAETTLSWYKGEEKVLSQSSSELALPLTVSKKDFNSSYRCEASNPADVKTLPVDVETSCRGQNSKDDGEKQAGNDIAAVVIFTVAAAIGILIVIAFIIKRKFFTKDRRTSRRTQADSLRSTRDQRPETQYAAVNVKERRQQGGHVSQSSGPINNVTTVYDKLEAHRMISQDTVAQTADDPQT